MFAQRDLMRNLAVGPAIALTLATIPAAWSDEASPRLSTLEHAECPVTIPSDGGQHFGNRALSTTLWSLGVVLFTPDGPGTIYQDGSLGMKWHWTRHVEGSLEISGRRLDQEAPALRSQIPDGYGLSGFQTSELIFPTPGCWEVTAKVDGAGLTFVTMVVDVCGYGALCN